jgi:signal transduction histidine kinase/ActR/RegA family two-component response regulator
MNLLKTLDTPVTYPQTLRTDIPRSYFARFALAALAYGAVVWASLLLVPAGSGASLVWPPAALGLTILFFWGFELWPALVTGIFVTLLLRGYPPPLAAFTALANVTEAMLGVYILTRFVRFIPMFSRLRDSLGLVLVAFIATIPSATIITLGVSLYFGNAYNPTLWSGIWIGHAVSILSFGPFFLRWLYRPLFTKTRGEVLEGIAVFGSLAVLNFLLYWTPYASIGGVSLLYVSILPLVWAALRTGPRGASFALFLMAIIGSTGVIFGHNPGIESNPNISQVLFSLQMVLGTLSLIFMLFASITEERKEAVRKLEEHVGALENALEKISSEDQAKTDFIAILAHELRNPLSPLLSGLELMKAHEQGPQDIIRMMGAHLHTIARLLDDLLDISRISQKKFKLQKQPVEIHTVIAHTLEMVTPQIEARRHTLTTTLPQEELWLNGDPVRLSQIFVNLLNNAAKYTEPGGRITLTVAREGDEVVAVIKDTGIGIPPERIERVFEPFGGIEGNRHSAGGLRIGLSLAKRMAEMHQGNLVVRSEGAGRGSEFTVRLPLPPSMPLPLQESPKRLSRNRFSKQSTEEYSQKVGRIRVLLVDDNEAAAQSLCKLLEHNGRMVTLAYDGPEGLERATETKPDVVLLDIGLPTMDGYEVARRLRSRYGDDITLVALTGYGQTEDRTKAHEAGFDEHLVKPVSITDVERVIAELHHS